jgi:hypothetical protein
LSTNLLFLGLRDNCANSVQNIGNVFLDVAVFEQLVHGLNHHQADSAFFLLVLDLGSSCVAETQLLAHLLGLQALDEQLDHQVGVFVDEIIAFGRDRLGEIVAHGVHCCLDFILEKIEFTLKICLNTG